MGVSLSGVENYSGVGLDAQSLFLLGRSYMELKDVDKALVALSDLIKNFGDDPLARQARNYMKRHNRFRREQCG